MRNDVRNLLGLTALGVLVLTGCSPAARAPAPADGGPGASVRPLTDAQLRPRLLEPTDLGTDFRVRPQATAKPDETAVVGCPPLEKLGPLPADGSLGFPHRATVSFAHPSQEAGLSEEIYSDTEAKISGRSREVFTATEACPEFRMVSGTPPLDVTLRATVQKVAAPRLGDEQWGHVLTLTADGRPSVTKVIAVRSGNVLVVLSGSPALVDAHVDKALAKALKPTG
ncbi:hypothetical protein ACFWAR_04720 [Streptomyces sp. NPDC059917]|uniref:hypothetical protein n=1 Tax=Streptomyces sp. NPDC059917 TaxID=3347002 RepID=UPI003660F28D